MDHRVVVSLVCVLSWVVGCGAATSDGEPVAATTTTDPATSSGDTGESSTSAPQSDDDDDDEDLDPDATGCCVPHGGPGCDEALVQACVCDAAPECCAFDWDAACTSRAMGACDATCTPDPDEGGSDDGLGDTGDPTAATGDPDPSTGGTGPGNDGPCCDAVDAGVGCGDADVQACVCGADPYCCDTNWDAYCVAQASQGCGVDCHNDCCVAHGNTACNDVDVFGCVTQSMESCWVEWTQACVMLATSSCGLQCG